MIVLFTHRDDLEQHGKSLAAFTSTLPEKMKRVLSHCGNRYLAFDNRVRSTSEKQTQVTQLLMMIDKMVASNGGRCYTNDVYKEFDQMLCDRERKLKAELKSKQDEETRRIRAEVEEVTQKRIKEIEEKAREEEEKREKQARERERVYQQEREQEKERERERERNAWQRKVEDLERERREQQQREKEWERKRQEQQQQDELRRAQEQQARAREMEGIRAEMDAKLKEQTRQAEYERIQREANVRNEVRREVQVCGPGRPRGILGGVFEQVGKWFGGAAKGKCNVM